MELIDFLYYIIPINTIELLAAVCGTYYLKKAPRLRSTKLLVYFLWFTLFVELIGSYASIGYFSNYTYFSFVLDTPFKDNYWWYNSYGVLSYSFYALYFRSFVRNKLWRGLLKYLVILFVLSSSLIYVFTDVYFNSTSQFVSITGTLIIFLSIMAFYFELLRSDKLLKLKLFLPFYISVGILVFNLCITPVDLFSEYFNISGGNELFVNLHIKIMLYANIFMYFTYSLGFIVCSRKKKFS